MSGEDTESAALAVRLDLLQGAIDALTHRMERQVADILRALEFVVDDDPRGRRELAALRDTPEYRAAFTDARPLISVLIPTYNRVGSLIDKAIPSVLRQTYGNVEVVVAGDGSPAAVSRAVHRLEDPRVRFVDSQVNGPYEGDVFQRWAATGTPPLNRALAAARGQWLGLLCDDDAYHPGHLQTLLTHAQHSSSEFVYGDLRIIDELDLSHQVTVFPPAVGHINLQTALWHGGLRFLQFELAHGALRVPNDWGMVRRMMKIGVTMSHTAETAFDWRPSPRTRSVKVDVPDDRAGLHGRIAELADRLAESQHTLQTELTRAAESERLGSERQRSALEEAERLQRELGAITASRSWQAVSRLQRLKSRARQVRRS